jgi:hypothetical protein
METCREALADGNDESFIAYGRWCWLLESGEPDAALLPQAACLEAIELPAAQALGRAHRHGALDIEERLLPDVKRRPTLASAAAPASRYGPS